MELGVDKGLKFVESHFSKKSWISRSGAIRAEKCRDRSDHVENWSDHRIMLKIGRMVGRCGKLVGLVGWFQNLVGLVR